MTIQLAKAKTVRKKRTETELQQKLKKLNPYIRRSFISRDLMMCAELFCEDSKGCLLDIRFRRLCSDFNYARIHNDIMCDDKSDKKRLLRLAQVRYRLLAILNAVNAAKDDANIVARCFTAHISNGNRLLSALSVCESSIAVSDCSNTLSIDDCKDGDRIDLFRMHEIIQDALSHFDGEMQRLDIKVENLEIDCGMDIYMKTK